jgi:hypothetical protein
MLRRMLTYRCTQTIGGDSITLSVAVIPLVGVQK